MRQLYFQCTLLVFVLLLSQGRAQIVVTPSAGCAPGLTNANFTYSGPSASSLTWNFGDGSPTSNLPAPQHSYLNVGSYTVTCTAVIGGTPQNFTFVVTVYPLPSGSMNAPVIAPSGCAPRSVTLSASSGNTNLNYTWAYGDNTIGSGSLSTHAYVAQGSFLPILTILDTQTGCSKAISGTAPIHVSALPSLQILSYPGTFSCSAPFTTAFSASTSVSNSPISGGGLSFNWNFGNSQTSTQMTPGNITYNTSSVYTVVLSATDNNNCTHSVSTNVSLVTPTLQVTTPSVLCVSSQMPPSPIWPYFNVTVSTSQTTTIWDMGANTPTFQFPNPNNPPPLPTSITPNTIFSYSMQYAYTTPGPKILTISVNAGTCVTTQTKTIFVEEISPAFATSPHIYTCSPSIVAHYTNFSVTNFTTPLSYTWTGQGWGSTPNQTLNTANATFTFVQGSLNPYTIYKTHKPYVHLQVRSAVGCITQTVHVYDSIRRPTALFTKNVKEGCAPLAIVFNDSSYTDWNLFPITSYTWNNGATPPVTQTGTLAPAPAANSVIPNFTYTYTTPGIYYPFLEIQTQGGCSHKSFIDTITVVNPPNIAMTLTPNLSVCAGQSVQVNLSTTNIPPPQHWHVQSGENYFSGCVSDPHPVWAYHNPGVYDFTITAYLNSCSVSIVPVQTIQVKGPAVAAYYTTNCANKKLVDFTYALRDVQNVVLNFGTGAASALSIPGSPGNTLTGTTSYSYNATGDYTASITGVNAINGCGPYTQTMLVTVREPLASFSMPSVVCQYAPLALTAVTSTDNLVGCTTGYVWTINQQTPQHFTNNIYTTQFMTTGIDTVKLRVKDVNGCEATQTQTIRVANPVPSFTFNFNPICFSQYPVQLINTTAQSPDPVNSYTWMYGPPLNTAPFPQTSSIVIGTGTQTYNFNIGSSPTQTFDVKLVARDVNGCTDSLRHKIQVNNPQAFYWAPQYTCTPGGAVTYYFQSQNTYTNYNLSFGGAIAPINTPNNSTQVNFPGAGTFTPVLTVTDNQGCTNTFSSTIGVQVYPIADFTLQTSTGLLGTSFCKQKGSSVTLSLTSVSSTFSPTYYQWDLGIPPVLPAGTNSNAGTSYTAAGTYTLKLTLMTSAPCIHTKSLVVNIYDEPEGEASIDKNPFCMGDPIMVTLRNDTAVHHWQWDFGDSQPTQVLSLPSHTTIAYNYLPTFFPLASNGELTILLTMASPFDVCKTIDTIRVKMIRVLPDFKRNNELALSDYAHCIGPGDTFSNTTISNASALSYTWSFGDGGSSFAASPQYTYTSPGNYQVQLIAKDPNVGCTNSVTKTMSVFPLPTASLSIDNLACPDSVFTITGGGVPGTLSGGITGTLSSPQSTYGLIFQPSNSFTTHATAPATTVFSLQITDVNGCSNSPVTDTIRIQTPPPSVNTVTTVIVGQTVTVNGYVGSNFNYTWTPLTTSLSCTNCSNPVSSTTVDITYTVSVIDLPLQCFEVLNTHTIKVELLSSLDVPSAFTPNGDGVNDFIGVGGWGIRKLIYFKVFNRWGQLLYESNDLDRGWDGTFNGIEQNMETYIYQASVDTYTNETLSKSGSFKLIR
ncbi:MAG TPA: PKD domain-containing protein [Bacteroidia bacterium]|nr:PKD domain-containing protein [Bacteroidia bacterium]